MTVPPNWQMTVPLNVEMTVFHQNEPKFNKWLCSTKLTNDCVPQNVKMNVFHQNKDFFLNDRVPPDWQIVKWLLTII